MTWSRQVTKELEALRPTLRGANLRSKQESLEKSGGLSSAMELNIKARLGSIGSSLRHSKVWTLI